ncbi:hypothetical protein C8J27_110103 [Rhodobacter aestuarii]|uniref:Restriction alleviation protein Lar n=1 Tax=Rhodobacter aestuarii TaxID=453582 RepID=A0A1N7Q2W4_9RHOB|nr:Lar family restriction alleviation protein [Rhodobacter aestuarii]PTV94052.1 hypothetical protein C8J27_110103 [Rhodobacter aestuarii]SIT17019.1 hypothetical protein SAMN05421580_112103 [Rhodobacter aestuarii]
MAQVALKPCPFCGAQAKLYGTQSDGYLHCPNDACPVKPSVFAKRIGFKGSLIDAWNTRATLPAKDAEQVDHLLAAQAGC